MFLIVKKFGIQNTSFKRLKTRGIFNRLRSEDLPHKSGIKTKKQQFIGSFFSRKTCPTNRGLRLFGYSKRVAIIVGRLVPLKLSTCFDKPFNDAINQTTARFGRSVHAEQPRVKHLL